MELGVGQQAQELGGALGAKLGQVRVQVAALILPPGARGDTEPARPDEFGFDPVDPQGQLGLTVWVIWSASEHAAASADCLSGDGSGKLRVWTVQQQQRHLEL